MANGEFNSPNGVAIDSTETYLCRRLGEYRKNRIQIFNPDGTFLSKFGSNGTANGQLKKDTPVGVAVDNAGKIYVADTSNHRVQVFAPATIGR